MAKINVSLPDKLLEEVDDLAAALGRSRSGLVQEAAAEYVTRVREELEREQRRQSIDASIAGLRALAEEVETFDGTAAVRADRDRDGRRAGTR